MCMFSSESLGLKSVPAGLQYKTQAPWLSAGHQDLGTGLFGRKRHGLILHTGVLRHLWRNERNGISSGAGRGGRPSQKTCASGEESSTMTRKAAWKGTLILHSLVEEESPWSPEAAHGERSGWETNAGAATAAFHVAAAADSEVGWHLNHIISVI